MKLNIQDSTWQIEKKIRKRRNQNKRKAKNDKRPKEPPSDESSAEMGTSSTKKVSLTK